MSIDIRSLHIQALREWSASEDFPKAYDIRQVRERLGQVADGLESSGPFFGIYHDAWRACCEAHNIDWTEREERRFDRAAKESPYNPKRPLPTEGK